MTTSEILEISEDMITPEMAIIVYKSRSDYYLERRDIIDGKMSSGVPLTKKCIIDIADSISSESNNIIHGAIPGNMLYADCRNGQSKYIWWRGPEKRQVYFRESLRIPNGEMWVPGLVYYVNNDELRVYSFTGRKPKNKLFKAPFFNVYSDDRICLGDAKVKIPKELTYEGVIQYWEDMFWKSEFSSFVNGNTIKGNLSVIARQLIASGERFPESELKPIETKLKGLLK